MASFHRVQHRDGSLGDIIQCAHDPCTLHGDMDIQADTLEDAYKQVYDGDGATPRPSARRHPHVSRIIFNTMKRTVVPFIMVAMMASLSACGDSHAGYDNSDVLNNPSSSSAPAQSSSSTDTTTPPSSSSSDAHDYSRYVNKDKMREYSSKAKHTYDSLKGRLDKYLDEVESKDGGSTSSSLGAAHGDVPSSVAANTSIGVSDLKSLQVVPDHGRSPSYNRKEWSNSSFAPYGARSCWSVRDEVIKRQADPGTLRLSPDGCSVEAVSFTDPYSGRKITESNKKDVARNIQIDHMVPISYMDSNGGESWPSSLKDSYYNDMTPGHLIAVSSDENSMKSDYGPSGYMPSGGGKYQLAYTQDWVAILKKYSAKGVHATIEQSDYDAIMKVFNQNGVS